MYKNNNYMKVLDIRQEAEKEIAFYREQIISMVNKRSLIHSDQTVSKQLLSIQDYFKDYQLALYLLGFSSFLEVMLLENFAADYLADISAKLDKYSFKYRELYSKCYNEIEGYSQTSMETSVLNGIAKAATSAGKVVERIPVINKGQVDETFIVVGNKINKLNSDKLGKQMRSLIERQSNSIRPFIESINVVNEMSNRPVRLLLDNENIYIATIE